MPKKLVFRIFVLIAVVLLLAGCADMERLRHYLIEDYIAYSDMEYSRPDMEKIDDALIYADIMGSDHCPVGLLLK